MPTIAMLSDFGIKDGNVGVMKGVIWGICPEAQIADLSHTINPQNIREAALVLARSVPFFPAGTVFLVVVDPGVGTARRAIAARLGDKYFVGPDNGLITMWVAEARSRSIDSEFVVLDRPEYWRPTVSHVFHGRDIFSPIAAHLAQGTLMMAMGTTILDPVLLRLPQPRRLGNVWEGEVIHIDHFGNIASNIQEEHLGAPVAAIGTVVVELGGRRILGLVRTFGERNPGEIIALMGSTGNLIVAAVNGNAATTLGSRVGDVVRVTTPNREDPSQASPQ